MRRRELIAGLGSAAAWPLVASAQQGERMRRVGVLIGLAEEDPETQGRLAAFRQGMQERGWSEGRNLQIDYQWAGPETERVSTFNNHHSAPIISAAARYNVPAVYPRSFFARNGGLLSCGVDVAAGQLRQDNTLHRVATYVDRILPGAKPGDLPVQFPAKYELILNLKTAKALGLAIPPNLLAIAGR